MVVGVLVVAAPAAAGDVDEVFLRRFFSGTGPWGGMGWGKEGRGAPPTTGGGNSAGGIPLEG